MNKNKNNIDEVLEEFDKEFIKKEFNKEFNQSEICLQDCHPEEKVRLLNFIKQKLQQQQDNHDKEIIEVKKETLINFISKLRGDLMLHPDLENINDIISNRLEEVRNLKTLKE